MNIEQIAMEVGATKHPAFDEYQFTLAELQAFLARVDAERAKAGAVEWQYRTCYHENTCTPGWGQWEKVEPRNPYVNTVEDSVREIQTYIDSGCKYELRALYLSPTLPEGWKAVPVEPTEAMLAAYRFGDGTHLGLYKAMLTTAPEVPK